MTVMLGTHKIVEKLHAAMVSEGIKVLPWHFCGQVLSKVAISPTKVELDLVIEL
jgi:hypothetical protein